MLHFLRKIRRSSIDSSKIGKYFIYAIGEIALIMIGILLALQVNNWNQIQQRKNKEIEILKSLKEGLQKDIGDIQGNIKNHQSIIDATDIINTHLSENLPYNDSLKYYFSAHLFGTKFNYATSAYQTLKSLGVDIISNEDLREEIIGVYDRGYAKLLAVEQLVYDALLDYREVSKTRFVMPIDQKQDVPSFGNGLVPLDYKGLKTDNEYQYIANVYREMNGFFNVMCNMIIDNNNKVIKLIDEELAKLEMVQ